MLELIKSNVLGPLSTRIGTLSSGALVGIGASVQHANIVGTGVAAAILIAGDLVLAWYRKRSIQRKTLAAVGLAK
jgi:hypothetical protein